MSDASGLVVKSTGSWYAVDVHDQVVMCRILGKFKLDGLKLTNPVAVGDRVDIEYTSDQDGVITKIHPRENYVVRESPRKKGHVHLLASNIDQAFVLTTIAHPKLKAGFIDRFLIMTDVYRIPTTILINKSDLYNKQELELAEHIKSIYSSIGYKVLITSIYDAHSIEQVANLAHQKITMIGGHSGVGKSSILNALVPNLNQKTEQLSNANGKGQHTTTFAEMINLPQGGRLIDTPGIKSLSFNYLSVEDIQHNFREIFANGQDCKFRNCLHIEEPSCAVKAALNAQKIHLNRYMSYMQLVTETKAQNTWENQHGI